MEEYRFDKSNNQNRGSFVGKSGRHFRVSDNLSLIHICNLKIAGTGPLEDELKDYTKSNNVTNVEFLGYNSGKELTDLVENAYFIICLLYTSRCV